MTADFRSHISDLIAGHGAHITFDQAIEGFPFVRAGERVEGLGHTAWSLVFHMRKCQSDIIVYCTNPSDYEHLEYPSGYWPASDAPPSIDDWNEQIDGMRRGIAALRALAEDTSRGLFETIPSTPGHTLARELMIIVAHNGYHIGQLVSLRMVLGIPVRDW